MAVDCVSGAAMVLDSTTVDVLGVAEVALRPGSGDSVTNQIIIRGLSGHFPMQRFRFIELGDLAVCHVAAGTNVGVSTSRPLLSHSQ